MQFEISGFLTLVRKKIKKTYLYSVIVHELEKGEESMVKYQIADVNRVLNSITEICVSGHPEHGHHAVFGRSGGMVVNLETRQPTNFGRDENIYCQDYCVKPFHRPGS